jgi:FixJ family two-component response regulator
LDAVISIVDDDACVREATKGLLESHGYAAEAFAAGEEFLESGYLDRTECLITDVWMPGGLGGIELQRRLLDDGHRIPIIFMTAKPEARIRTCALQAGAYGFLSKPFQEEVLFACLEKALQSPTARS